MPLKIGQPKRLAATTKAGPLCGWLHRWGRDSYHLEVMIGTDKRLWYAGWHDTLTQARRAWDALIRDLNEKG